MSVHIIPNHVSPTVEYIEPLRFARGSFFKREVNVMKNFRRGQAAIEFALILPIFAMVLFALIYLGFLFIDVVTLDSAAAAARDATLQDDRRVSTAVKNQIKKTTLFLYWYKLDTDSPKWISDEDGFITYGVQANLDIDNSVLEMFLPKKYTVVKSAYKEE